jgi:hypothetical protein
MAMAAAQATPTNQSGTLRVTVVACRGLKSKDLFSKNDDFVILKMVGGTAGRTTEVRGCN